MDYKEVMQSLYMDAKQSKNRAEFLELAIDTLCEMHDDEILDDYDFIKAIHLAQQIEF